MATLRQLRTKEASLKARRSKHLSDLAKTREELKQIQAEIKAARAAGANGKE